MIELDLPREATPPLQADGSAPARLYELLDANRTAYHDTLVRLRAYTSDLLVVRADYTGDPREATSPPPEYEAKIHHHQAAHAA